ncbi:MAG: hypothetical protein U0360_02520 [Dehalococcoidia bacterium]
MPMLKLALIAGACGCLCVSYASWVAGFPPEIALTRGVAGFMAFSLLGFFAELITADRPPELPVEAQPHVDHASRVPQTESHES